MNKLVILIGFMFLYGCANNPIVVRQKFPIPPEILMQAPEPLKKLDDIELNQ